MYYLGIDPSLISTGICLLNSKADLIDCTVLSYGPQERKRLYKYFYHLNYYIEECHKKYSEKLKVGLEAYAYGKAGQSMAFNIGELGGALKVSLQSRYDMKVIRPLPTEVKSFVTGKPRADKKEVRKVLEKKYKYEIEWEKESQILDLYDALAIALITFYFYRRKKRNELNENQKKILKKIDARVRKESLKIAR